MIIVPQHKVEFIVKNYWDFSISQLIEATHLSERQIRKVIEDYARDDAWNADNDFRRQMRQLNEEQRTLLLPYLTHPKYRN